MRTGARPLRAFLCILLGGLATTGCHSERIGSQLEAEAVFACGEAIEELRGVTLPAGWRFRKEERNGEAVMKAWAPGRNEPMPPDYTCVVVRDDAARGSVRVVDVVEGARKS